VIVPPGSGDSPTPPFLSICCSADGTYVAVVADQGIYTSSDGGSSYVYNSLNLQVVDGFRLVECSNDGEYFYVGTTSGFWRSGDFGVTWSQVQINGENPDIKSMDTYLDGRYVVIGLGTEVWTSIDYGVTFYKQQDLDAYYSDIAVTIGGNNLSPSDEQGNRAFALGGTVQSTGVRSATLSTDTDNLTVDDDPTAAPWQDFVLSDDGDTAYACCYLGSIFKSVKPSGNFVDEGGFLSGRAWSSVCASSDASIVYACVYGGFVFRKRNDVWTARSSAGALPFNRIACSDDGQYVYACFYQNGTGSGFGVMYSQDFGVTWAQVSAARYNSVATRGNGAYAYGCETPVGDIESIDGYGMPPFPISDTPDENWFDVDCSADGRVIVGCGRGGYVWVSTDYGSAWSQVTIDQRDWMSVSVSRDGKRLIASVDGGLVYYVSLDF
jgi:hypothetical protein